MSVDRYVIFVLLVIYEKYMHTTGVPPCIIPPHPPILTIQKNLLCSPRVIVARNKASRSEK